MLSAVGGGQSARQPVELELVGAPGESDLHPAVADDVEQRTLTGDLERVDVVGTFAGKAEDNFRSRPGRALQSDREHHVVLELILEKDGDTAEQVMREHVRASRRALLAGLPIGGSHKG
ncbi:FCD domain-containing protein [Streptomyces sp. NPDC020951]|uniref:FCD domain-containing protein n=1 Tax=Streptomyces sp. NPDC020951 TaxID=3365104 RepID=UPI0037A94F5C